MLARRALVSIKYSGIDITDEIREDLLSFSYTDNASGESDSISITLKDEKKKWARNWFPTKGDVIEAVIRTRNWEKNEEQQRLPCGRFYVDQPEYSGRPSVLTIGAVAAPLNSNFSQIDRSRTWRNITLFSIAQDIARRAGLRLETYIGNNNPRYQSIEQTETPDAAFLADLCEQEGLVMKVTDRKIIIFDERVFERRAPVATIHESNSTVLSYSFRSSTAKTAYAGVNVKYYDAKLGRTIQFLYAIKDIGENDKVYQLNSKVRTGEEARRLAQRTLRRLNKKEFTGSLDLVGNVDLVGGSCVELRGFGGFSGKYYIEQATHTVGANYTTSIEVRKVLEGY